jgi:hypothetical protein
MKYLETNLNTIGTDYENLNILAIFLHLCSKNKESFSGLLKLSDKSLTTIVKLLNQKTVKYSGSGFIAAEDFFLVHTLFNLLSKSQLGSHSAKIKKLVSKVCQNLSKMDFSEKEQLSAVTSEFYDENGQIAEKSFYDKTHMGKLLLESKNGCLKSGKDIKTYISQPLTQLVLKKLDFTFEEKNSLMGKILENTLHLDNMNWIVTENLVQYRQWLRIGKDAQKKASYTLVLTYLVENTKFASHDEVL